MPRPDKNFQVGAIEASIFENEIQQNGKTIKVKKVAFQKRYKSLQGWKTTYSLDINDIPKAVLALSKAYEFLVMGSETPSFSEKDLPDETDGG